MKATDVMVGNFVKYKVHLKVKKDRAGTFIKITADDILYLEELDEKYFVAIEPIPLTPEILEKCGLVKKQINGWDCYEIFTTGTLTYYAKFWPDKLLRSIDLQVRDITGKPVHWEDAAYEWECLHDLQNGYKAISRGEELTVNL